MKDFRSRDVTFLPLHHELAPTEFISWRRDGGQGKE